MPEKGLAEMIAKALYEERVNAKGWTGDAWETEPDSVHQIYLKKAQAIIESNHKELSSPALESEVDTLIRLHEEKIAGIDHEILPAKNFYAKKEEVRNETLTKLLSLLSQSKQDIKLTAISDECVRGGLHDWGTCGLHTNTFCKKCFIGKPNSPTTLKR